MRGRGGRLLIGLVVAAVAVGMYLCRTEVNPVTGEKQRVAMSVDQEKALGLQAAPQMAAEMGGELDPASNPEARLVDEVGAKLVRGSNASRSPYADTFDFHLLEDPKTINAFALPGGQVFITKGLYDQLETEAQLAGVLGHETGHVVNRHSAEHLAKGQLGAMLAQAAGVAADDGQGGGRNAAMIAAVVNQVVQLKYSRKDESESDRYGIDAIADAGYDPRAMLQVLEVLKRASEGGQRPPEFLSSHPMPETRLKEIEEYLRQKPAVSGLSEGRRLR